MHIRNREVFFCRRLPSIFGRLLWKELIVHIAAPGGQLRYKIPTLKAFHYTMKELLEQKLFLLIPFHILVYKKPNNRL